MNVTEFLKTQETKAMSRVSMWEGFRAALQQQGIPEGAIQYAKHHYDEVMDDANAPPGLSVTLPYSEGVKVQEFCELQQRFAMTWMLHAVIAWVGHWMREHDEE